MKGCPSSGERIFFVKGTKERMMLLRASRMSKNRWQMFPVGVNQKKSLF